MTRIALAVADPAFAPDHPRSHPEYRFRVLGGYSDFLVPSTFVDGHGAITGLANIAPVCVVAL